MITLTVAVLIALVTALGIWVDAPVSNHPTYERMAKVSRDIAKLLESHTFAITQGSIAKSLAPAEAAEAQALTGKTVEALLHQAHTLEVIATKLRQRPFKN